ncbi:PilN domain-containing protein [Buttiauxella sp.]|uniref:PilN domain-containing protein n=1 Tax=Buttiauxella sp. TaxID=1972222 RepID=UPI003C74B165
MSALINLLPWRQTLRQQRVRRWSVMFVVVLILVPLLAMAGRQLSASIVIQQQIQSEYLAMTLPALQALYEQRLGLAEQHRKLLQLQQVRDSQQHAVQVWERRLIRLADGLPAGAWLSSLALRKGRLEVKGQATDLEDMHRLEKKLAQLDGVAAVKTDAIQQEALGRFGFGFTLTLSEVANALAH